MLMLLAWVGLLVWHWHMARRKAAKKLVTEAERELAAKLNRYVRVAFVWAVALWVLFLVVYVRATAAMDAADGEMARCRAWMKGAPLQACVAPAQAVYVDEAGAAATSEVFLWVLGVL